MSFFLNLFAKPSALKTLDRARALLSDVTPLHTDCGKLCGAACCQSDETGENGMLLFPFEDEYYKKPVEGFAFHLVDDDTLFRGGKRLVCEGSCPRDMRPLMCRVFPLRIRVQTDATGEHSAAVPEIDPRSWCVCPLPDRGGLRGLNGAFVEAVRQAGETLLGNVFMLEALLNEQKMLDETRRL